MMTYDQIMELREEERREGRPLDFFERKERISLSLQQAARNTGLPFQQCPECHGAGYTKMTLLASPQMIEQLARTLPNEAVPIQYDKCGRCDGTGGWLLSSFL